MGTGELQRPGGETTNTDERRSRCIDRGKRNTNTMYRVKAQCNGLDTDRAKGAQGTGQRQGQAEKISNHHLHLRPCNFVF